MNEAVKSGGGSFAAPGARASVNGERDVMTDTTSETKGR